MPGQIVYGSVHKLVDPKAHGHDKKKHRELQAHEHCNKVLS